MFKEFGVIFIVFLACTIIMRQLYIRRPEVFKSVTVTAVILCILINIIFNLRYVYPEFVYEGVPIGDSRENLFVYKSDSQFRWHILNRVTENRIIRLEDREQIYERYFSIFSAGCEEFQPDNRIKEHIIFHKEAFDEIAELSMVKQLTYAFPKWEREELPLLYLNTEDLKGCNTLIGIVDEDWNLYVMSEAYYGRCMEQLDQEEMQ